MNHDEATLLLAAYRDGELDLTTSLQLEKHLAGCSSCQQRLAAEQELVELVQAEAPRFKPSPFLKTRLQAKLREQQSTASPSFWKHPALAWLLPGGAFATLLLATFLALWPQVDTALDRDAIANHVRSLQASHLVDVASTDQHTVKPWFAGKLDYSPQVVDLTPSGYPLIGGRLDVLDHRDVAAIIYQRRKHYINLFIWPATSTGLDGRLHSLNGYHALGWSQSGMNYLAVSELGEKEFHEFIDLIRSQTLDTRPGE